MKTETKNKSFQKSIGPVLTFGQVFAMLPVDNITSDVNEDKLQFRWISFKTIYAIIFLVLGSIESCLASRRIFVIGFSIIYVETFLFYVISMAKSFMIFRLATKWKEIMRRWSENEKVFLSAPYEIKGWSLRTKLTVVFCIMVFGVFSEHLFFLAYAINNNYLQVTYCNPKSNIFWDNFLSRYRPHIRHFIKYSPYQLPLYEWVNLLQAFAFSYTDIFIMLMAIGITTRFNQYIQLFRKIISNDKIRREIIWRNLRIDYIHLVELTKFIDKHISGLVLISTGHNMLTMILKFYSAFKPSNVDILNAVYFWFFLTFLTCRTLSVLLLSASINEAAKKPMEYIRNIPNKEWNVELKRLFDIILMESPTIGFSGKQLFFVTRGMILTMIGTIITFEIILLDEIPSSKENLCDFID
ncbi:hypothetical protein PVAND_009335 [Polypedilum vanderplanki]|uniref:Gustatory receptor n=1 Tax=Polypedilum vanderplanki TaxID=319348 RepID=A0A9J6CCZ6_POLVA|nr:hypothetical protein PVAND_009335 [Polypedilum vanderplanki]